MIWKKIVLFCVWVLISLNSLSAQNTLEKFGKNRVQHKKFYWRYLSTANFDVYYYDNGSRLANFSTRFLESEFDEITDKLGYTPYFKTKIFIYNSISDLQQSNIGLEDYGIITGGQTNLFKSQVEIPFTGSEVDFKKELRKGIAEMLVREMMFGGSLKDMLQSSYLNKFSDWFLLGAAAYVAEGWSEEMDDHVRDLFRNKRNYKPNLLSGKDAVLVGQSIWNYIAEKYGAANISSILNLARIIRNERNSIAGALGIRYNTFLDGWRLYYKGMADEVTENTTAAEKDFRLRKKNKKNLIFNEFKFNPEGSKIAYSENKNGKFKVIVQDVRTRKKKRIYKGGYDAIGQRFDENVPLLSWRDNSNLGIMTVRKGEARLSILNMRRKLTFKRTWFYFNHVSSFDFSDDGNFLLLSADRKGEVDFKTGQNDIYLYNILETNLQQITDDWFDDQHPAFLPNSNTAFVFSSNRVSDSLSTALIKDRGNYNQEYNNFELFIYNPATSLTRVSRLTYSPANDIQPKFLDASQVVFLNDESGIYQLKKINLTNGKEQLLSNYPQSVRTFDVSVLDNSLAYLMIQKGRLYPNYKRNFNFDNQILSTFKTFRGKNLKEQLLKTDVIIPIKPEIGFTDSTENKVSNLPKEVYEADEVDTDNYQFEEEILKDKQSTLDKEQQKMLEQVKKVNQDEIKMRGPYDYKPRFRSENVVTTVQIDPLRGWGLLMNMTTSDLLENHKVKGGFFFVIDLKSSDFFGEYQFFSRRFDISTRYDRKVIYINTENATQRYTLNKVQTTLSYPINNLARVSFSPFYANTLYTDLDPGLISALDHRINYSGGRLEFVFDNTVLNGQNMISGTRIKIGYDRYQTLSFNKGFKQQIAEPFNIGTSDLNFDKLTVDVRKYIPLHKDLILATRVFYGRFGGSDTKRFLLGGMDNWLFNQRDGGSERFDPLTTFSAFDNSNILFHEFVTNLRGFNYNKMSGEQVLLLNMELRLPIFRYLFGKRLNSNFFKNFQFVGFYDVGSAWTGKSPFNRVNSANTRIIGNNQSPFVATVNDFKNPWLAGYGAGLRTVLLGYYLKIDLAWGVEDFITTEKPKLYVTFGYDF